MAAGSGGATGVGSGGGAGTGGSGGNSAPAWQTVLDEFDLDGVVLSLWGSNPNDVYAVGGPLGNTGYATLVVHFTGGEWHRLQPGGGETYWWVSGSGPTDVWMTGEQGRITHWNGSSLTEHVSGTNATLWGIWAASPTDAWAVGGTPNGGTGSPNDIVLHWNGTDWLPETLPGAPLGRSLYKVWGTSSNDLYVVGEKGTIWHRAGTTWTLQSQPSLTQSTLFTVHGCDANEVYAVGGTNLLRSDGQSWTKVNVSFPNLANGVACNAPGTILVVGFAGVKHRLLNGIWYDDFFEMPYSDLHGSWADGSGTFWAGGGDFTTSPTPGKRRQGIIARFGKGVVASTISP